MKLDNPWKRLPRKAPFFLPEDRSAIDAFNGSASDRYRIRGDTLPVPYLGLPDAPILLLNLNPGYSAEDASRQRTARFQRAARKCLVHEAEGFSSGFYFLDSRCEGIDADLGPGTRWSWRIFGRLRAAFGNELLARSFFCVEYFLYHSYEFRRLPIILDSQRYGVELVRSAVARRALIIIMRSGALWRAVVPELGRYSRIFSLKNPRMPVLSDRNCPDGFPHIVRILDRAQKDT